MSRKWEPAPPDPGIKPGGIRDRALRLLRRGSRPVEMPEPIKTPESVEVVKQTEVRPGLTVVTAKFPDQYQLRPYKVFTVNSETGHQQFVADFTHVATALHFHDQLTRKLMAERVTP